VKISPGAGESRHIGAIDKVLDKLLGGKGDRKLKRARAALKDLHAHDRFRILTPSRVEDDAQDEASGRNADDYIGRIASRTAAVAIEATKQRGEALDHTLLTDRPDSARRRARTSLPTSSAWRCAPRRAR
jgi:hypothetical protein